MFVSDTSTLVLLAKVECLETFIEVSPTISIPVQVQVEALFDKDSYYSKLIQKLVQDKKIKIIPVNKNRINKVMTQFKLDEGEAATYVLFNDKKYGAILTDDGELIKLCKLEKTPFICAMAVIIRLYEKNKLSKEKAIKKLENLYKLGRYSKELYEYFKGELK